ncbi:unnamed protein product [Paramecium pentaurelia]|uniref:Uncharacterized protein n=1 Tax=Paramecium pentaurelia TaxID=43138 RepID=A0A8S1XML4_9CILI|nr:unnamed protein product [Paramecium pentaurelia]
MFCCLIRDGLKQPFCKHLSLFNQGQPFQFHQRIMNFSKFQIPVSYTFQIVIHSQLKFLKEFQIVAYFFLSLSIQSNDTNKTIPYFFLKEINYEAF